MSWQLPSEISPSEMAYLETNVYPQLRQSVVNLVEYLIATGEHLEDSDRQFRREEFNTMIQDTYNEIAAQKSIKKKKNEVNNSQSSDQTLISSEMLRQSVDSDSAHEGNGSDSEDLEQEEERFQRQKSFRVFNPLTFIAQQLKKQNKSTGAERSKQPQQQLQQQSQQQ